MPGPQVKTGDRVSIGASAQEIRRASVWLAALLRTHDVPADTLPRMDLCLNETLANVLEHGGAAALATSIEIGVEFGCSNGHQSAILRITDGGVPFDVPQSVAKTLAPSLAEATPGGLGIHLLRSHADTFSYRLHQGKNELMLGFTWVVPG